MYSRSIPDDDVLECFKVFYSFFVSLCYFVIACLVNVYVTVVFAVDSFLVLIFYKCFLLCCFTSGIHVWMMRHTIPDASLSTLDSLVPVSRHILSFSSLSLISRRNSVSLSSSPFTSLLTSRWFSSFHLTSYHWHNTFPDSQCSFHLRMLHQPLDLPSVFFLSNPLFQEE